MRFKKKSPAKPGKSYKNADYAAQTDFISEKEDITLGESLRGWVPHRHGNQTDKSGDACCRSQDGFDLSEVNRLGEELRYWAKHHNWTELDIIKNGLKLQRAFGKPVGAAVAEFIATGRVTLALRIKADFASLLDLTREYDTLCRRGCGNEDEYDVCQHIRSRLEKMMHDLATLIEGSESPQPSRKIVAIPSVQSKPLRATPSPLCGTGPSQGESGLVAFAGDGHWITMSEAADLVAKHPATIGRWVQNGTVRDNGKKGRDRRVAKADILLIKQTAEENDLQKDAQDLRRDARMIR